MEATSNPTFKNFFHPPNTCFKTIKNAKSSFVQRINNKIASCQTGSRSFLVYGQSCLPNLLPIIFPSPKSNSDSSSTTSSSKANLFASVFASNSNLNDKGLQPRHFPLQNSLCHPRSSPHENSPKPFSSLTPPSPKALTIFHK